MTRDSQLWWWLMAGALFTTFSAHFDLLEICCALSDKTKALIELGGVVTATVSGVMRASPIHAISDEGREKFEAEAALKKDRP